MVQIPEDGGDVVLEQARADVYHANGYDYGHDPRDHDRDAHGPHDRDRGTHAHRGHANALHESDHDQTVNMV